MKSTTIAEIKTIVFFLLSILFTAHGAAQNVPISGLNQNALDSNKTFFEIQRSMNDYWSSMNVKNGFVLENGIEKKVPNWKLYKRWEYYWEQRVNQTTGEFPNTNSVFEYEKYKNTHQSLNKENTFNESWVNLGTNSSAGGYAGIGRINCIAFHPTDANTFWVGSPSGGIWKTTDGGSSWTNLNDNQAVLGVSAIAVDYTNPDILYIATGDRDGGSMSSLGGGQATDNASIGVLKSTDGGATWNTTGLTYTASDKKRITSLLIHPSNNSILFAAMWDGNSSNSGIWKSTDAGAIWVKKTSNLWMDMEFKPGDPTIMYASSYGFGSTYINRSTNSGEDWSLFSVAADGRRGEIAVTPADPTVVYLLSANSSGGVAGVYKSTDSGANFSVVNAGSPVGMLGYYTDGRAPGTGQGTYDWCIAVDPSDANTVFIGGITTWKSTDGGVTFNANNNWTSSSTYNISGVPVVHADKHALAYQNSSTLFEGNDGGIYKTTNGGTSWTDLTNGLVISQIYRIGVSQTDQNVQLAGLQDNGSKKYTGGLNTWVDVHGGDGMECIVDFNNATSYMYATYITGQIFRNSNGYSTFAETKISANIPGGQPTGAWVTPYIMDPTNAAILYAGYDMVWKTTDRGNTWTTASQVLSSSNKLRSLAIAPSNPNVLYAADQTNMWKTTDGGATNWSTITLPTTSNSLTYIAVKNTDPNTVWITYGGYTDGSKVYQSTDGGTSWTNISTGLPNLPVMCIVYYKDVTDRDILFVGTDVGVYVKDGTNDWASYNTGLPNVVVTELEIYYGGGAIDKLRAGTYGRGLWETDINSPLPVELSSFTAEVQENHINLKWITQTEVNNYGFEVERNTPLNLLSRGEVQSNDDWKMIGFVNGNGNSNSPKSYSFVDENVTTGNYSYRLKQIDNDGQFEYSDIVEATIGAPIEFALNQNYPNPFNPTTTINYSLPKANFVTLAVYNSLGEKVSTLVNQVVEAGNHTLEFNAENLSSGIYFVRMDAGSFLSPKKITLMK